MSDPNSNDGQRETAEETAAERNTRLKQKISNDERNQDNIEQYILSRNIDNISRYYNANKSLFGYRTFRQINGASSKIVNSLRGIRDVGAFMNIRQSVLSLMQPKLRLYKVTFEGAATTDDGRADPDKQIKFAAPCYREFRFSDNFGFETAATVNDYLNFESTKPHFRNVGLKSFAVEQMGMDHGAIEHNISCRLELVFKSLKDLTAQPPGEPPPPHGVRYVDLILFPQTKIDPGTKKFNPEYYQIKALLGYTAPSPEQLRGLNLTPQEEAAIKDVEKFNMLLSLGMHDHTIDIKEDGQASVSIDYRGAIETSFGSNLVNIFQDTFKFDSAGRLEISGQIDPVMNTGRIFNLVSKIKATHSGLRAGSCADDSCVARKNAKSMLMNDEVFYKFYKDSGGVGVNKIKKTGRVVITDAQAAYDWLKDENNIDRLLARMKRDTGKLKKEIYSSFMTDLIKGNKTTRLFCASVGKNVVKKLMGVVEDPEDSRAKSILSRSARAKRASLAVRQNISDTFKVDRCDKVSLGTIAEIEDSTSKRVAEAAAQEARSNDPSSLESTFDAAKKSIISDDVKSYQFYFLFLGDIIELACRNAGLRMLPMEEKADFVYKPGGYIKTENEIGLPTTLKRLLLGPVEYIGSDGQIKRINLAEFPISFNAFRSWFVDVVIRRHRINMPLGTFITNLITRLVLPSMGAEFLKPIKPQSTRAMSTALTLPGVALDSKIDVCGRSTPRIKELLPNQRVLDVDSAEFRSEYFDKASKYIPSETAIKTSHDYWLVYISTIKDAAERNGDPREDIKDGIYHFNIGSDVGLLKTMKFSKVDQDGLAELYNEQALEESVAQIKQLAFTYNVDLELVGNALFSPGMDFYANPSFVGLGRPEDANSIAHQLNLGGYFFAGVVTTDLDAGGFRTKIKGLYKTHGKTRGE